MLPCLSSGVPLSARYSSCSCYSVGEKSPAELVAEAVGDSIAVLALADRNTVEGVIPLIIAAKNKGLYGLPAVELLSREGPCRGYLVDVYETGWLEALLRESGLPSWNRCVRAIWEGGGVCPKDLGIELGQDSRVLPALFEQLPAHSVHKNWAKRLRWRASNLTKLEFEQSLRPRLVTLKAWTMQSLLELRPGLVSLTARACPFVLVRPEAEARVDLLIEFLKGAGARIVKTVKSEDYPRLAWLLQYKDRTRAEALKELLSFEKDRLIHGEGANKCWVVFFEAPEGFDFRAFKKELRRRLGSIEFLRVRCGEVWDECFSSFVHMPDEGHVVRECALLEQLAIAVP